jgi:hypothetical protein
LVLGAIAVRIDEATPVGRARSRRLLGGLALAGFWFVAPAAYVLLVIVIMAALGAQVLARVLRGLRLGVAAVVFVGILGILGVAGMLSTLRSSTMGAFTEDGEYGSSGVSRVPSASVERMDGRMDGTRKKGESLAAGAALEGVTPVALTFPDSARVISATKELVTRDRPFVPVLYYVTGLVVGPVGIAWLVALGAVLWHHRPMAGRFWVTLRKRLDEPVNPGRGDPGGSDTKRD